MEGSRFEFDEILPDGAQGEVHVFVDQLTNKKEARKRIRFVDGTRIPRSFIREAAILFDLEHANVVRLNEVVINEGALWLVMEFMPLNLKQHMEEKDNEYPAIIRPFLKQLLSGIHYCHSLGVIHRDLKPENLLVDDITKNLKICDFGLSRGFTSPSMMLTPKVGSRSYRAPEVLMLSQQYSVAADMWAVGCIFAEMVTKKGLFNAPSDSGVLDKIIGLLGTPSEDTWPGVTSLPGFPPDIIQAQPQDLAKSFGNRLEPAGVDLLSGRITAEEALGHNYFNGI